MEKQEKRLPVSTIFFTVFLIVLGVWFLRGESYRLYASLFFGLYYLTNSSWISIILVAVVQNIAFLPLRFLGEITWPKMKAFEEELEEQKSREEQGFLLKKKVYSGDWPVVVYTINFVLLLIAFISAGRVFLLDFYSDKHRIDPSYLYSWVPYPEYPAGGKLEGVMFPFVWVNVLDTKSFEWFTILKIWAVLLVVMFVPRLLWKKLREAGMNKPLFLELRIKLNRIHYWLIGILGTLAIFGTYFFRNIPTKFEPTILYADLSLQNTTFNIITALATFVAAVFMGRKHHKEEREEALKSGKYEIELVEKIYKEKNKETMRNALLIATMAYFLTHLMPCSHDLSVLAFEAVYILASYTIDPIIRRKAATWQV